MNEVLPDNEKQEWIKFYNDKALGFSEKHVKAKEWFAKYKVDVYCKDLVDFYYGEAYKILDSLNLNNISVLKNFVEKLRVRIS